MARSRFRGNMEHNLDDKGRLNFPSRFRDVLRASGPETLMVIPWMNHLRAYPVDVWEELETKLMSEGELSSRKSQLLRILVGRVIDCSLDKQGRILIPLEMRNEAKLDKEVVLAGMMDWVEIWDKRAWQEENEKTLEDFDDYRASLAEIGIF